MTRTRYTINVQIDEAFAGEVEPRLIRAAARAALEYEAAPSPWELTIALTNDQALHRLNRDYLGYDQPTDVLSFPARESEPESQSRYLGDIAISFERAMAQAETGGHPAAAEIQLLVVHGVLHLLGHDHAQPDEKKRMWAVQSAILRQLKAPITGPANL